MIEQLMDLDSGILLYIQEFLRNDVATVFFRTVTTLGNAGAIWLLLSFLLLIPAKTRRIGCMSLLALLLSLLCNNMLLKHLVARSRPYDCIRGLVPLITRPTDYSFPSGHTAASFAAATVLFHRLPRRYGVLAVLLAVLIGFSRLYLGVHYPSDVLAGALIGCALGYAAEWLVSALESLRKKQAPQTGGK